MNDIDRNDPDAIDQEWYRGEDIVEVDQDELNFSARPSWFAHEHNPWSTQAFASSLDVLLRKREECQRDGRAVLAKIAELRGEETAPGMISLWGVVRGLAREIAHIDALAQAISGRDLASPAEPSTEDSGADLRVLPAMAPIKRVVSTAVFR